jgi:imidazolonepropionase-like amidohydrolase
MRIALIVALSSVSFGAAAATTQSSPVLLLEHANVFTGASSPQRRDVTITIVNGRIEGVADSPQIHETAESDREIDLKGAWVLPGLIDAHVHVSDIPAAKRMLSLGITTGRSMLTTGYEDVGLKSLYDRGNSDIPDILSAGFPVVAHPNSFQPDLSSLFLTNYNLDDLRFSDRIGASGARRIVDANAMRHVDWIKVFGNGRAGILKADPTSRDLNDEELVAAVEEATAHGTPVAVHAYTDDAVSAAVKAGVRTIEHGSLITMPTLELMRTRGVCFTPTLSPFYVAAKVKPDAAAEEKALASRAQMMLEHAKQAIAIARRLGVVIIAGADTDYESGSHTVVDEILHLAEAGLSPSEVLDAATARSAACLRIEKQKGSIQPGVDADLVVYASDPTADLHILRSPLMVITRGSVFVDKISNR